MKISDKFSAFFHLRTTFPFVLDASFKTCTIHSIDLLLKEVLVTVLLLLSVHSYQTPVVPDIISRSYDLNPTAKYMVFSMKKEKRREE
uniref:Putative ovule protein n=1 Tax=Solanum chacoense TaxID=4108 RepID=A0A0V0GIT9_SOLCH